MRKSKLKISIILEVSFLFIIGILVTGIITYIAERKISDTSVKKQTELKSEEIARETKTAITEFPAYQWLIMYWYEHPQMLDVEYDALFTDNTVTRDKCKLFEERHPDLQLRYLTRRQCEELPEEDQKLYAEIAYSWLLTRINGIKAANGIDYVFCVVTEEPYTDQFFLFSAAEHGAKRGFGSDEAYVLGKKVTVGPSQVTGMREAVQHSSHLADANGYVDYYSMLFSFDGHMVLIGLTYDMTGIKADIDTQTTAGSKFAILNQIILSLLCLLFILLAVILPLRRVQKHIHDYTNTKDSKNAVEGLSKVRQHNEIGQLAVDVSEMAKEIDFHVEKTAGIIAEKERINTELSMATKIQAAMLPNVFPPFPDRNEFDIYASMDPAKEVGGDFYDFFLIDDDHLALVIADVSGKGIPASLFMMVSKILIKNHMMSGLSPAKALEATNNQICSNNKEDMFVTVWLGVLEISSGKLTAANAGHEYPVIKKPGEKFELIKDKHGLAVGAMEGVRYREYELQMEPGSKLFVYTDGVPEATDADNAFFGTERMVDALNEKSDAAFPKQILGSVRRAVDRFVKEAEQFDDLTMLCIEYRGAGPSKVKELTVDADRQKLDEVLAFVDGELEAADCPLKVQTQIDVAVEEIFVNIASYSYPDKDGTATIRVELADDNSEVTITLIDEGKQYDPTARTDPDVSLSAEERGIGGLGIYITKKFMEDVVYEYVDGRNHLKLRKLLK
ncbi:MAG: SpoIIE family protein phosphatase [Clostridiales bacterium]|nr:SpoIIE family protein phosphatase [Clostridiales bacterium]